MLKKLFPYLSIITIVLVIHGYRSFFPSDPVVLKSSVKPQQIFSGQVIQYRLDIIAARDVLLELPEIRPLFSSFLILDHLERDSVFLGRRRIRYDLKLTAYEPGEYVVPNVRLRFREPGHHAWRSLSARERTLRVKLLDDHITTTSARVSFSGGLADFPGEGRYLAPGRDLDMPVRLPINEIMDLRTVRTPRDRVAQGIYILLGVLALIFLGLSIFGIYLHLTAESELSPHEMAKSELEKLSSKWTAGRIDNKEFCSELYRTLTIYTLERFGNKNLKLTAQEFIRWVGSVEDIPQKFKDLLKDRIELCELVKYSSHLPGEDELDHTLKKELEFIDETTPREEEEDQL